MSKLDDSPEVVQLRDVIQEGWIEVKCSFESKKKQIAKLFSEINEGEVAVIIFILLLKSSLLGCLNILRAVILREFIY